MGPNVVLDIYTTGFWEEVYFAYKGCIHLITVKIVTL